MGADVAEDTGSARLLDRIATALEARPSATLWDRLLVRRRARTIAGATIDGNTPAIRIEMFREGGPQGGRGERVWARIILGEHGFLLSDLKAALADAEAALEASE